MKKQSSPAIELTSITFLLFCFLVFLSSMTHADSIVFQDYTGKSILRCCRLNGTCDIFSSNVSSTYVPDTNYTTCYEIAYGDNLNFFDWVYDNLLLIGAASIGLVVIGAVLLRKK